MLEGLTSVLNRAGSRSAGGVLGRVLAISALLSVLASSLMPASAAAAGNLDAVATRPAVFGFAIQGDVMHLRIAMRNTGDDAWDPAQGFRLRRLGKDGTAVQGESYPVERTVEAGQTASWDIMVSAQNGGLEDRRYAMFQGDSTFGSPARAVVIILPNLEGTRRVLSSGMGGTVQAVTEQAARAFGDTLARFGAWVRGLVSRVSGLRPDGLELP